MHYSATFQIILVYVGTGDYVYEDQLVLQFTYQKLWTDHYNLQ